MSLAFAKEQTIEKTRKTTPDAKPDIKKHSAENHFASQIPILQLKSICPCDGGCPSCVDVFQLKPIISQPNDKYEQEADHLAEEVTHIPEMIDRSISHEQFLARGTQTNATEGTSIPPIIQEVLRSQSQPLDPATRTFMEQRFGHDFSRVRVHTDQKAEASARRLHARAYTIGRQVIFGERQYLPRTKEGRRLIAHEMAHVIQQEKQLQGRPVVQRMVATDFGISLDTYLISQDFVPNRFGNLYSHPGGTHPSLEKQILIDMLHSPRVFHVKGYTDPLVQANLEDHIQARKGVVDFVSYKMYKFGVDLATKMNPKYWWVDYEKGKWGLQSGVDPMEALNDLNITPSEYTIACRTATWISMVGGSKSVPVEENGFGRDDWVPGDWGYIKNTRFSGRPEDMGLEGEHIIYLGYKQFWGHIPGGNMYLTLPEWESNVNDWGEAKLLDIRRRPSTGLFSFK